MLLSGAEVSTLNVTTLHIFQYPVPKLRLLFAGWPDSISA